MEEGSGGNSCFEILRNYLFVFYGNLTVCLKIGSIRHT